MTTIIFPILTFTTVFFTGIAIGMYISSQIKKRIDKQTDNDDLTLVQKDDNGNLVKIPVQDHTYIKPKPLIGLRKTKIKLNKYELDYLMNQIEKHLNSIGETYEESEYVKELYENLLKTKTNDKTSDQWETIQPGKKETKSKTKKTRKKKKQND
tara:strand:- start:2285 stop:2746 length:462 start_codon:yes stop_codon:yes gene_type:complete